MVGRTISHYRIVAQLGAGGMGVVYRAEDIRLGREVAVKFVSEDFAHDEQAVQRLRSEARAASALNHAEHLHHLRRRRGRGPRRSSSWS